MSKPSGSRVVNEYETWGEPAEDHLIVPEEVSRTVILSAVKPERPKVKLPMTENDEDIITLPIELTRQNDVIRYTIKLNQHAKAVQRLLRITTANKNDFRKCPPVPETLGKKRRMLRYQRPEIIVTNRGPYRFSIGQGPMLPLLCSKTIQDMLRKAVVVILAQAGFDRAEKSTVDILVDVIKGIMSRLTTMLHVLSQKDIIKGSFKFEDTIEKTLKDVGMNGITSLAEYWRKGVTGKKEKAFNKSCILFNAYTKLVNKLVAQYVHINEHIFAVKTRQALLQAEFLRTSKFFETTFPFVLPTGPWPM